MAEIAVVYKVYVENPAEIENIKEKIENELSPKDIKIEDVGFGIKFLKVLLLTTEEKGTTELEKKLESIEGISSIETESATRL